MNQNPILKDFEKLPLDAQKMVIDFIAFLRSRYAQEPTEQRAAPDSLADEAFVGMWRDRADMADSSSWVRSIRDQEWH